MARKGYRELLEELVSHARARAVREQQQRARIAWPEQQGR
jgi:hypothetical protein